MTGIKSIDVVLRMDICLSSSDQIASNDKINEIEDYKRNSKLELNALDEVLFCKEGLRLVWFVYFISLADKVTDKWTFLMLILELPSALRPHLPQACFSYTIALDLISLSLFGTWSHSRYLDCFGRRPCGSNHFWESCFEGGSECLELIISIYYNLAFFAIFLCNLRCLNQAWCEYVLIVNFFALLCSCARSLQIPWQIRDRRPWISMVHHFVFKQ